MVSIAARQGHCEQRPALDPEPGPVVQMVRGPEGVEALGSDVACAMDVRQEVSSNDGLVAALTAGRVVSELHERLVVLPK